MQKRTFTMPRSNNGPTEILKDVLERQQAQLKTAERQLEKAEKDAASQIIGSGGNGEDEQVVKAGSGTNTPKTLEQDLTLLANTEGCWDDSDEEGEFDLRHSVSQPMLTTVSSLNDIRNFGSDNDGPMDAWDL
jgi:hypothetical protein